MANFYIADTHFGHYNIIKHSRRNFMTAEEMNEKFIENWNHKVGKKDHVWIVGDFSALPPKETIKILKRLNGRLHLVVGNHDKHIVKDANCRKFFESIHTEAVTIYDNSRRIVLWHFPMAEWDGFYRGAYHFFGHIHNNFCKAYYIMKDVERAYNVGTDILGYTPQLFDEVIAMNEKFWAENEDTDCNK